MSIILCLLDFTFTQANDRAFITSHILVLKVASTECAAVDGNFGLEVDVASSLTTNDGFREFLQTAQSKLMEKPLQLVMFL